MLAVIWGLGVISLLITSFMSNGRLRLQTAFNIASAAQANLIADGAIGAAVLSLLSERNASAVQADRLVHDGTPLFCVLSGAAVAVSIEEEGGKVDINSASPKLLQAMLMGFGVEMRQADALANAIVTFRTAPTNDITQPQVISDLSGKPFPPKRALFQTALELDQVEGIDAQLFRELTPFVTVHSRSPGVDARSASPALFAALSGLAIDDVRTLIAAPFPNSLDRSDPRFPSAFTQGGDRGAFRIHVEALLPTGQAAAREAVVDLRASSAGPYAIRELRRGATTYIDRLRAIGSTAGLPDC